MAHPALDRVLRFADMALRIATSAADKVPHPDDPPLVKATKTLAFLDAIRGVYRAGKTGFMRDMTTRYNLTRQTSAAFVRLFFGTELHTLFDVERIDLEHMTITVARRGADLLFFEEYHYPGAEPLAQFHHTPRFPFDQAVDVLWARYTEGLYLSVDSTDRGCGHEMTFAAVPKLDIAKLTSKAAGRVEGELLRFEKARARGRHRTYLCVGEPGSGKSAFTVLFAKAVGGRPLKIDAAALPHMGVRELEFMIESLRPSALIVDDLDRAPMDAVSARILFVLELIKGSFPTTPILLTVNDVTQLDRALLRPRRIEVPLLFEAPDGDEQREILGRHAERLPASVWKRSANERAGAVPTLETLLKTGDTLTHAYLAEVAERLEDEDEGDVIASILLLRELAQKAASVGAIKGGGPSPSGPGGFSQ